ncbi:suppressor of fused domain protein [Massilia sp. CF038]|uniref:suppressor of fused domain protein n=1 Tax=Massilia sp. CF038 TaxID=1881045 RepID=UPI0009FA36DB|nr:suppressor of fused domain protein [Massilia sp. CF038]
MGTVLPYMFGGPDPLDGISIYQRTEPVPHWHYVTYGFSELYAKESEDPACSGYGIELTFRLRAHEDDTSAPIWAISFLQNLARYVFETGNVFSPGDRMSANGPIAVEMPTAICAMAFVQDPELPPTDTANGHLTFLQVVGLTVEEEQAAKHWQTDKMLQALLTHMPLWVTDLGRASLLNNPAIMAEIQAGTERDGSSSGAIYTAVLTVRERKHLLRATVVEVEMGAHQIIDVCALLPLRIPFEQPYFVNGPDWQIRFEPGKECGVKKEERVLIVTMDAACARAFAGTVLAKAGRYQLAALPTVVWQVKQTLIKDANGSVVRTVG